MSVAKGMSVRTRLRRAASGPFKQYLAVAAAALFLPTLANAADAPQKLSPLAAKQHCDECHAVQEVRIGPSFLAVALRYAGERPAAQERLARKIINGGAGNWGNIPMVPNERVSLEDARAITQWILSLAPPASTH